MNVRTKRETMDALREQVFTIESGNGSFRDVRQLEPRRVHQMVDRLRPARETATFGKWLLQQTGATGLRAELIAYATADRSFPSDGTPEDVRERLNKTSADSDMHAALDDAELDWSAW